MIHVMTLKDSKVKQDVSVTLFIIKWKIAKVDSKSSGESTARKG